MTNKTQQTKLYKVYISIMLMMFVGATLGFAVDDTFEDIELTVSVDGDQFHLGDHIKLDVIAENSDGYEVSFLEAPKNLGEFSLIESYPKKFKWTERSKKGYEYVITTYETGTHVVPPIPAKYRKSGETTWQYIECPQVPIEIVSVLTDEESDIRDIKGLAFLKSRILQLIFFLCGIGLLLGAGWLFWHMKKRVDVLIRKAKIKPAHVVAYEELVRLRAEHLPESGRVKEYYTKLSNIVRHYLENRFLVRAPEMTTEEFLLSISSSKDLVIDHKKLLEEFLLHCDMVKFAKYGPTQIEMLDSFKSAENFVEQTKIAKEVEVGGET